MSFPINFADPVWLWLAVPALAIIVVGWMAASRTLPAGRRIASLVIRVTLAACLILSLAGMRLALPSDRLSVVFLLDASASMLDATSEELVDWARTAVREMPEDDTAGVVVFGGNALVDRLPSQLDELAEPASAPVAGATDVGAAVRLAAAIFPAGTQQRIVLLSDGNDTSGEAEDAIAAAAARGIRLDVVTPADESAAEVLVDVLDAPPGARVGETIDLMVRLRSTITTGATLRLLADGATVATRELELEPGITAIPFSVTADAPGFHVFRAVIEPETDRFSENNAADAYVLVSGPPQVLVATDDLERAADLITSLEDGDLEVTVVPSGGVPSSLTGLASYDSLVLDDVPASALGAPTMAAIQSYVRDLGKGLVMLGGRDSYGAGGYLDTPLEETLPVYMTVRDRERSPDVAMVAVVDKSGSMADCHCTGDSRDAANPSGQRGFEKVDIAKEAILRAAEALAPTDQLGVVAFDSNAHWAVRTAPIDFGAIGNGLGFAADGSTNIYAGLKAAYDDLVDNPATLRHIILITDGWSTSGAYDELLDDMQAAGITLSTIGTGGGSARILRELAEESGGRYYDAADATTIPDIFLRETIRTAGEQIVEETFQPIPSASSEVLDGMDAGRLPQLLGYNATTAKGSATVALLTGREDPLLAQWQYGLGRAAAWTSDARQQWATPWIGTPEFGTLTAQLVAWTLPPQDSEGIDVRFSPGDRGELNVEVTSFDDEGGPRNFYHTVLRLSLPTSSRRRPCSSRPAPAATPARSTPATPAPTSCAWPRRWRARRAPMRPAARSESCLPSPTSSDISASTPMRSPRTRRPAAAGSCLSRATIPEPRSGATTSPPAPSRRRSGPGSCSSRSSSSRSTSACAASPSPAPTCDGHARGRRGASGSDGPSRRPSPVSPSSARRRRAATAAPGASWRRRRQRRRSRPWRWRRRLRPLRSLDPHRRPPRSRSRRPSRHPMRGRRSPSDSRAAVGVVRAGRPDPAPRAPRRR